MADRVWWLLEVLALMRERRSFVPYNREAGAVKHIITYTTILLRCLWLVYLPTYLLTAA